MKDKIVEILERRIYHDDIKHGEIIAMAEELNQLLTTQTDNVVDAEGLKPKDVEIIDIADNPWNCDKCLFFKHEDCECMAVKRLLFGQALRDDCDNGKRPFVLKPTSPTEDKAIDHINLRGVQKQYVKTLCLEFYHWWIDQNYIDTEEGFNKWWNTEGLLRCTGETI